MIRATHGVHNGAYYWECQIGQSADNNAHVRIGWSTRQGELQAPVGYDRYSFAYRDISGMLNYIRIYLNFYSVCSTFLRLSSPSLLRNVQCQKLHLVLSSILINSMSIAVHYVYHTR